MYKKEERIHVVGDSWTSWGAVSEKVIEKNQEDAFYVMDMEDIINKVNYWKEAFPRIDAYYAMKCNNIPPVLEILSAMGVGFHCASQPEYSKILSLKISPSRILYANPVKPASHIRNAQAMGIQTLTFDSEFELAKIKELFPKAKLVLRFSNDAKKAITTVGKKFGCQPKTEALQLLKHARELGLDVVGVSFNVGTGCQEPEAFSRGIEYSAELFSIGLGMGHNMDLLNLGGGFPGELGTLMDEIVNVINTSLEEHFPLGCGVRIVAEPGRYFVSSAFTLACCIFAKRLIHDNNGDVSRAMYYINDGKHGSFGRMNCITGTVTAIPLKGYDEPTQLSHVWGPTGDGSDHIFEDISLPNLHVGDWLVFRNSGAYTLPVASMFEGSMAPKVTAYVKRDVWLMLRNLPPFSEERFICIEGKDRNTKKDCCSSPKKTKNNHDEDAPQEYVSMEDLGIPEFPYW